MIPSQLELREGSFPTVVVEQLRQLSMSVLQRLLGPILHRWRSRRARIALTLKTVTQYGEDAIQAAAYQAMIHTSALGHAMPALASDEVKMRPPRATTASLSASTVSSPTSPHRSSLCLVKDISADELQTCQQALRTAALQLKFSVHLRNEHLRSPWEPGHEVLLLLAGTLRRTTPTVGSDSRGINSKLWNAKASAAKASHRSSSSTMSLSSTTLTSRTMIRNNAASLLLPLLRPKEPIAVDTVHAPLVLGELPCIGGFPACENLTVESEEVFLATMSTSVYCTLLSAMPLSVQRVLMMKALRKREAMLPFFAPITVSRLRLCPLLTLLKQDDLEHILEYAVPKVYASGMLCSEQYDPKHIFFIRRGTVRMECAALSGLDRNLLRFTTRGRTKLVEGHTFGESMCIFQESLGEAYYAVSHVDAYLLPFNVLVQRMKVQPEVMKVVRNSARALSLLHQREFKSVAFSPLEEALPKLHHPRTTAAAPPAPGRTAIMNDFFSAATPQLARKVTIFERCDASETTSALPNLRGGRVSTGLIGAMLNVPLLNLIADESVLQELTCYWKCVTYRCGDAIVQRGEECNRLLLFFEGQAGIVINEMALRTAKASLANRNELDLPPVGTREGVCVIPPGHIFGYTCARRHRWTHTVLALEDHVEVWEVNRATLLAVLRKHNLDRLLQAVTLQILQPLAYVQDRLTVLDYQPLLVQQPGSLWLEGVPSLHPVARCEQPLYPTWKDGDFPANVRTSITLPPQVSTSTSPSPMTSRASDFSRIFGSENVSLTSATLYKHSAAMRDVAAAPIRSLPANTTRREFVKKVQQQNLS